MPPNQPVYFGIRTIRASEVGKVIVRCMPRSFLSAFHSPADSSSLYLVSAPSLLSIRPFEACRSGWPAVERDHSSGEGRRFKKNSPRRWSTHGEARTGSTHCNSGSRLEAERGSWIKNGFGSVFVQPVLSGVQLPATVGTQFARSLARSLVCCFASFCESFTFTTTYLANQPVARSLARPSIYAPSSFLPQCSRTGCVRRGPEFHGKSLGYIFTSGAIKAVGVRPFLD